MKLGRGRDLSNRIQNTSISGVKSSWSTLYTAMLLTAQESRAKFRPCQKFPPYLGRYPLLVPDGHQIRPDLMKRLFVLVMLPEMGGRSGRSGPCGAVKNDLNKEFRDRKR